MSHDDVSEEADREVIAESWPTGARFFARRTSMIEQSLIDHQNWEFRLQLKMLNRMGSSGTFVDCGANIGVHSCAVARHLGDSGCVIAIEPVPWLADRLERNRDLNGLHNLHVVRHAAGASVGTRTIYIPDDGEHNQGMATFYGRQATLHRTFVATVAPLDEIVGKTKCVDVRVIKLDVEGAELEVLQGASQTLKRWRPHIFLEYNENAWAEAGATLADLQRLLVNDYRYELRTLPDGNEKVYLIEAVPPEPKRLRLPWRR